MDIETVIAIAKTLRPGFLRAVEYYTSEHELIDVALIYGIEDPFRGKTYLDALHAAGWNGETKMHGKAIIKKNHNKYGWDVFFRGMMGYYLTFDSALADALAATRSHKLTDTGCKE